MRRPLAAVGIACAVSIVLPASGGAQSVGPFFSVPYGVASVTIKRSGNADAGLGAGVGAGWAFSSQHSVMFVGDVDLLDLIRAREGGLLGLMGIVVRRRWGTLGGAPRAAFVGPITWEGDNSGLGILAGMDLDAHFVTGSRRLIALDLIYLHAASWRGEDPATGLPNTSTRSDPLFAVRIRIGGLRELSVGRR
jgi:hypothetical protein